MKKTKMTAMFLAAIMAAAGVLAGCGNTTETTSAEVKLAGDNIYPVSCEDTLTYWMPLDTRLEGAVNSFGDTPLAKELEKRTGVKIEYVHPQAGQGAEQFNIMLASNELPDIVTYNWASYAGGADQAIDEQYIYKLNDIIDNYAPALKEYLKNHPEIDKKIKTDSGNYFAFPFVRGEDWMTSSQGLMLRKDWMDKLGLDEPRTLDELENVLREFKKMGAKAPLVLSTSHLQIMLYAYGTAPDFYVDNGQVKYGFATEEYRQALEKAAQWYKEGLIDQNLISADAKYIQSRMLNGDAGACFGFVVSGMGALLDAKPDDTFDLMAIHQPTLDGGVPEYAYKEDNVVPVAYVAISTNCKNPELAARFLDYGYTEEGHMLFNFGIEGESYNMQDGKAVFSDVITNNPDGLSFAQAAVRYTRAQYSGIFEQDPGYVQQSLTYKEQQQHAYDVWADNNMSEHLLPPITLKPDEQSESADIMSNISTYASEKMIAYITGKESLDTFDDYLAQLKTYGIERAVELRQAALERYNSR